MSICQNSPHTTSPSDPHSSSRPSQTSQILPKYTINRQQIRRHPFTDHTETSGESERSSQPPPYSMLGRADPHPRSNTCQNWDPSRALRQVPSKLRLLQGPMSKPSKPSNSVKTRAPLGPLLTPSALTPHDRDAARPPRLSSRDYHSSSSFYAKMYS